MNTVMSRVILIPLFFALFAGAETSASGPGGNTAGKELTAEDNSFSFVVWGHPRTASGEPPLHFEEILNRISELKADFLIVTGDVISGGGIPNPAGIVDIYQNDWEVFDAGVSRLGIPVYRLPGNHDVCNFITRDLYLERYTKPPYAFTFKNSRFIMLDTVGIDQRTQDGQPDWYPQSLPFDDEQMQFIKTEISQQEQYQHVFFFMHHVWPWRDSSSFWWDKVHPLLAGSHTRAVFGGTPGNPGSKYEHFLEDGIHYIQSCTYRGRTANWYRQQINLGRFEPALAYQFNNLQYVRVEGDDYTIRTIVVGALDEVQLSSRFWHEVNHPAYLTQSISNYFHDNFHSFRKLFLFVTVLVLTSILIGIVTGILWKRRSKR